MRPICSVLALSGLLIVSPMSASAGPPPLEEVEIDPSGAVLCTWMFTVTFIEIGSQCFAEEDEALLGILEDQLHRIEAFIVRNSDDTPASLEEKRRRYIGFSRQVTPPDEACAPDGSSVAFYRPFRDEYLRLGHDAFRQQTDDWLDEHLAVDRKPVANPCL